MKNKKYRVMLALLLLVTIFMQLFPVSDKLNAANEDVVSEDVASEDMENKVLGPGKYLYLNPKWGTGDWLVDNARIFLYYETTTPDTQNPLENVWKPLEFEAYEDILRVKLPEDMKTDGRFKFARCNPAIPNLDYIWTNGYSWGGCPAGTENLYWSDYYNKHAGSNTYKLTAYSSGDWVDGEWNRRDYGGEELYFINMDMGNPLQSVKAKFSVEGTEEVIVEMSPEGGTLNSYSVVIPEDKEYDAVQFLNASDEVLGSEQLIGGDYEPGVKDTYYYNRTSKGNGETVNRIDEYPSGDERLAGRKLYFDSFDFPVDDTELYIQVGEETPISLTADDIETDMYSYTFPTASMAGQNTVITIIQGENRYHFLWTDVNNNMIYLSEDTAGVFETYLQADSDKRVVYFDATLSRLSYKGDVSESYAIPEAGKRVWCRAWVDGQANSVKSYEMTLLASKERDGNIYKYVWKAEIDSACNKICFFSGSSADDWNSSSPKSTDIYDIPSENSYEQPCFYADGGDDYVYNTSRRDGYWAEAYTIRDAESNKGSTVVDVPKSKYEHQKLAYYVPVTLYDYYTDYELNGYNRDNYSYNGVNGGTHNANRVHQPFRQFNMALSDYYRDEDTLTQIYWGNFQSPKYGGAVNSNNIAATLNLLGYSSNTSDDVFKKFFYQNNSMWGSDGEKLDDANNATVGLVSKKLTEDGNLLMDTGNSVVEAPFFNMEFLLGSNSKNTVLGKVYENVKFPFIQKTYGADSELKDINGKDIEGTVDYWYFNSADSEASNSQLRLKQDSESEEYYLEKGDLVKGSTTDSATANGNYFPFNDSAQSGNTAKLNYGFGQKMEFDFRLTEDGTVETTKENEKVPVEFTFSGDDDVWIFIDNYLVLDVGGGHGIVDGKINFYTRESTVSGVKNETGGGNKTDVTYEFPAELKNDNDFYEKTHTLTMFYMERGLWESNLHMTFNFPDNSVFSVEKEVDTGTVNDIFKDVYKNAEFPFNIKNQATHYGELTEETSSGFSVNQQEIEDYGSAGSGKLENAAGAVYKIDNLNEEDEDKDSDENPNETSDEKPKEKKKVSETGIFTLKDKERAEFVNQFRRGSYIYLKEDISQDNFKTIWELYDNYDEKVSSSKVPGSNESVEGGKVFSADDMTGTVISDGRKETYVSDDEIKNEGYKKTGWAKIGIGEDKQDTEDTIVFRSYSIPDNIVGLNIRVKEINTVRTGSVTITKEQAEDSIDLGDKEFEFKITFTNVSGMGFEGSTPIEQTIKLKKGDSYTIEGIPAGTEYRIEEIASEGYTLKEVKSEKGNDTEVKVTDSVVTGEVKADDDDNDLQQTSFIFVNAKDLGSIDIIKKDSSGAMAGVEFILYNSIDDMSIALDSNGDILAMVTDDEGKISFNNIPIGTADEPKTYYLMEMNTVKGHELMREPIKVTLPYKYHAGDIVNGEKVTEDGITNHLTYTIINDRVFELPSSGARGIGLYVMIGVILTVTAGGGLFIRARQKRNDNK